MKNLVLPMENRSGPKAIGIILDGNRRWAKERGFPSLEGHRKGFDKIQDVFDWCREVEVAEVTLYAFSTENWNRSSEEVSYLMDLFEKMIDKLGKGSKKQGTKIRFIGDKTRFSKKLQTGMKRLETETDACKNGTLIIALSYGGRLEILQAVETLLKKGDATINEVELKEAMWSKGLLDPDLIIRTGGEKRLSNFLTWQSVYSELFFTNTMWPDFSKGEFLKIIAEYSERERRHGK